MKSLQLRNSILGGIAFAVLFGIYLTFVYGIDFGVKGALASGILFGTSLYVFLTSKTVKKQTEIDSDEKEIVYAGSANHFIGNEAVGGKLYLLSDRLTFKSHNFNFNTHEDSILLSDIKEIKFYNTLGVIPNGLELVTINGIEKFVVNNRKKWRAEIEKIGYLVN